ncbi:hypothetical protein B9Z55_008220 [Caenorhabditis nigoni]|uniref:Caspase family p20 domain-containing protein n=1 Tax=Caenorhabditis nigoni TaxID=1611254 RepID=A0A2G5VDP7_9PELO|nr:hypothetical protein B9Z55_008220 [Caenorhabditis nigoni]
MSPSNEKKEPKKKIRRFNKKERRARRKLLEIGEEGPKSGQEYALKVKELSGKMVEGLESSETELGYRKRRLLRIAKVESGGKSAKNVGIVESVEHGVTSPETGSGDKEGELNAFWKEFETIGDEQSEEGLESPTYAENCEIFTNQPVSLAVIEKSELVGPEKMIGEPEDMEEPQESQILNDMEFEFSNKIHYETENVTTVDNLNLTTTPKESSAPDVFEKSLENSQESQESEKSEILDETDGEPPMDQAVHADSFDIGNVSTLPEDTTAPESKSDEVTKQGDQEECGGAFADWIKYNRELKKNQPPPEAPKTEKKCAKAKKSAKRPRIPKVTNQRQYFKKISTKPLDPSEVEKLKKLGITLKSSDEGAIVKPDDIPESSLGNQDNVKEQKKTSNQSNAVEKIRYQFKDEDLIYGERRIGNSDGDYKNEKRSKCLIVKIGKLEEDESMSSDVENLSRLFTSLNYEVKVVEDLTAQGIEDTVRRFGAESDHGDSPILCFVTHGCVDGVYEKDGKVFRLDQLYALLSPENSPNLAGKPKVIFSESCRGIVEALGEDQILERSGRGLVGEKVGEKPKKIPMNADFLFCYSTSPGHVAFAHPRFGAYHVQLLCRTIAQRAHEDDLETMMVSVRKGISEMDFKGEKGPLKQMPEHRSTLRRTFYFNLEEKAKK